MSNLDPVPAEQDCRAKDAPGPVLEFHEARDVPLGGVRGVHVMRALPQRVLPTVGAWCFLDHFGPDATPMNVNPHPHIGLQTVTWLFRGDVRHRDSVGSDVVVRPGQLNIMTAGRGIAHSEIGVDGIGVDGIGVGEIGVGEIGVGEIGVGEIGVGEIGAGEIGAGEIGAGEIGAGEIGAGEIGVGEIGVDAARVGHGLQLWTALPDEHRDTAPHFEQHRELPVYEVPGLRGLVFLGTLGEVTSPATAYSPIVGVDITLSPGAVATIPLTRYYEHAVMAIEGDLGVAGGGTGDGTAGTTADNSAGGTAERSAETSADTSGDSAADSNTDVPPGPLLYLGTGRSELTLTTRAGAHLILLGGEPFREDIVMWWNFVARTHEEIEEARNDWEKRNTERFPDITGHSVEERIPAPPLPGIRLKPRGRGAR